jgi:hypothetical protein
MPVIAALDGVALGKILIACASVETKMTFSIFATVRNFVFLRNFVIMIFYFLFNFTNILQNLLFRKHFWEIA